MEMRLTLSIILLLVAHNLLSQNVDDQTFQLYPLAWVSNSENEQCISSDQYYEIEKRLKQKLKQTNIISLPLKSFKGYYDRIKTSELSYSIIPLLSCDKEYFTFEMFMLSNNNFKASLICRETGNINDIKVDIRDLSNLRYNHSDYEKVNSLLKEKEYEHIIISSTTPPVSKVRYFDKKVAKRFGSDFFSLTDDHFEFSDFKAIEKYIDDINNIKTLKGLRNRYNARKIKRGYPHALDLLGVVGDYHNYKNRKSISNSKVEALRDTVLYYSALQFKSTKNEKSNIFSGIQYDEFIRKLLENININIGCTGLYEQALKLQDAKYLNKAKSLYEKLLSIDMNHNSEHGYSECAHLKTLAANKLEELNSRSQGIHITKLVRTDSLIKLNLFDEARIEIDDIIKENKFSNYPNFLLSTIDSLENQRLNTIVELIDNTFNTSNISIDELATVYLRELDTLDNIIVRIFKEPELTKNLIFQNKYEPGQYRTSEDAAVAEKVSKFVIDLYTLFPNNQDGISLKYTGSSDNLGFINGKFTITDEKYKKINERVCVCLVDKSEQSNCYNFQNLLNGSSSLKPYSDFRRNLKYQNNLALAFLRCYRRNDIIIDKIKNYVPEQFYLVEYCSKVEKVIDEEQRFSNLTIVIPKSFYKKNR